MQKLKTWTSSQRGRLVALAKHLGVSPPNVVAWTMGNKPIPMAHAAAIEQFTDGAVTRRDMFPDTWQRIWPELAAQQPAGQGGGRGGYTVGHPGRAAAPGGG